jgi:hypothetical protein
MFSGDKVFYGLKLSKDKIFKLLLNYICTNELQNSIYNHELFKEAYTIYKNDDDEINKIYIHNINFYENENSDDDDNNEYEDDNNQDEYEDDNNQDEDDNNEYEYEDEDIDDNYYNEKNKILLSIYDIIKDEGDKDEDDLQNMILLLLKILSFKHLTLLSPSCCNDDGTTFLGIKLGSNHITHRYIIDKYKNFHNYYDNYMNSVIIMKNKTKINKELYDSEFNKLIDTKPIIYSMANDCYRCT